MEDADADLLALVAALLIAVLVITTAAGEELPMVQPVRKCCEHMPPTLADTLRRLPPDDAAKARFDDDLITWSHEGAHFLNSRLSRPGFRSFYLLDGYAWEFPIPRNTRLTHVMNAIPAQHRGRVFDTYMVKSRQWWDDCALYPMDEAIAYWAGTMTRQEIKNPKRQETERYAVELTVYTRYAVQEIVKREPDTYPKEALVEFFDLVVARGRVISPDFDKQPFAEALSNYGRELVRLAEKSDGEAE